MACLEVLKDDGGPLIIPAAILAEIGWFLEDRRRFPLQDLHTFLADLVSGAYEVVWTQENLGRIAALVDRYRDLPLGIADASVIACAERRGGQVLATDEHFSIVARDRNTGITVQP